MARNRVIYQSEAVYVSQDVNATGVATGDRDAAVLDGVQNANYSFSISRQDVNCFGQLASLDRIITETPTVSLDASYYLANFGNENKLGFHVWADPTTVPSTPVSCISGLINSETNDGVKNYYILTTKEGADVVDNTVSGKYESIIGIGNASIGSYSTEASVGGLPTASFSAEGQNLNAVSLPYTGMYEGVTGCGPTNQAGTDKPDKTTPLQAGFETVGQVAFTVTGNFNQSAYSTTAGDVQTIQIQSGNWGVGLPWVNQGGGAGPWYSRTGIQDTIPAGSVFTCESFNSIVSDTTLTLQGIVEKGDTQFQAKLGGANAANFTSGMMFTGNFPTVVSYLSGSNPAIDTADGEMNQWDPDFLATPYSVPGGVAQPQVLSGCFPDTARPTAPIKLPVPSRRLTSSTVNPSGSISVLRPGDITITLKKAGTSTDPSLPGIIINSAPIQSYTISFDLSRTPLQKIGTKFAYARPVDFPVTASFSFDAIVTDLTTGSVADLIDCDDEFNATVSLRNKDCAKNEYIMSYEVRGLKMDDQSYSSSLGDNKNVSYSFSTQIGGPLQTDVGVFMSGYYKDNAVPVKDTRW